MICAVLTRACCQRAPDDGSIEGVRVLITNDDGIDSPGLLPLAHAALAADHEVTIVAPATEHSATAASLTGLKGDDGGFQLERRRPEGLDERVTAIGVHASPALIAYGAALESFGPRPDLILSGVNIGPNVGPAVVHSGTVGAALTAVSLGIQAIAASMEVVTRGSDAAGPRWDTAEQVIAEILAHADELPHDGRALSVNIPNVAPNEVRGITEAPLGRFSHVSNGGADQAKLLLNLRGPEDIEILSAMFAPGTDGALLAEGWATVSLIQGPSHRVEDGELSWLSASSESGQSPAPTRVEGLAR